MLTRRKLLNTAMAGSAACVAGSSVAQALTEQPMPAAVAAEYLAGCSATQNDGGHQDLLQRARALLKGEIASGLKPAGAEALVSCPVCGCRLVVTADN